LAPAGQAHDPKERKRILDETLKLIPLVAVLGEWGACLK
jgi:hypothetical protein